MSNWQQVPQTVNYLVKEGSAVFNRVRAAVSKLPGVSNYSIWFNPKTQTIYFTLDKDYSDDLKADWIDALQVKGVRKVIYQESKTPDKDNGPWIRIKEAALSTVVRPLAQLGGWVESPPLNAIGGPTPLSAMIASGALGAGAGHLIGSGIENIFPSSVMEKGKLRKVLSVLGGAAGALPGAWMGTINQRENGLQGWTLPIGAKVAHDLLNTFTKSNNHYKLANYFGSNDTSSGAGSLTDQVYVKSIDKDRFNRAVWDDPYLPDAYKGMASGVVEGASQIAGDSSLVSPLDIARLGVGTGSGWLSGLVVGKTLGALAGITPDAEKKIQQAGIFAGLVRSTVPLMFGR